MTSGELVGVAAAALAVALGSAPRPRRPRSTRIVDPATPTGRPTGVDITRIAWAAGAAAAGWVYLPDRLGVAGGMVLGVATWVVRGRALPAAERRERERVAAQLPHLVLLLATTLRAGSPPGPALDTVCAALPGPAADRLAVVRARLGLGTDPVSAYAALTADPVLAPLGRTLSRAHASGAPVADAIEALSTQLARERRARAEDRARAVGVRAALPLGVCLLPAFLLLGIVPLVAGLVRTLGLS